MANRQLALFDVAELFDVKPSLVEKWVTLFSEFLTPSATRLGANIFTQEDIQVFALAYQIRDWDEEDSDEDCSEIFFALNSGDHLEEEAVGGKL